MKTPESHKLGFTLLELMVSMCVGTMVLLLAAALLGSSGKGYGRTADGVASGRERRAALSQLSADLASAVFHREEVLESKPGHGLGFISLQAAEAQSGAGCIGDACAVTYQLEDLAMNGRIRRCLTRSIRESGETFAALREGKSQSLFGGRQQSAEPLAFGVVAFEVTPKSLASDGNWEDWEKNDETPPDALEVTLAIARPELLGRLVNSEDWDALKGGLNQNPGMESHSCIIRFGNHGHR